MPEIGGLQGSGGNVGLWFISTGVQFILTLFSGNWEGFAQTLLDPFDLWFSSVFSGRPKLGKDSATDDLAIYYGASVNPVAALVGAGIRGLEGQGIPTSTSNPTQRQKYTNLFAAFRADLLKQFGTTRGNLAYTYYVFWGQQHDPDSNGQALQSRSRLDQDYLLYVRNGWIDPKTGFPPVGVDPNKVNQPPAAACTDPCELIMQDLIKNEVLPALTSAASALWNLAPTLGPSVNSDRPSTIDSMAAVLMNIELCLCKALNSLVEAPRIGQLPVLNQIVVELTKLADAAGAGSGGFDPNVAVQLKRVADDLGAPTPTPVKRPAFSPFVQDLINQAQALRKNTADVLATVRPDLAQILSG